MRLSDTTTDFYTILFLKYFFSKKIKISKNFWKKSPILPRQQFNFFFGILHGPSGAQKYIGYTWKILSSLGRLSDIVCPLSQLCRRRRRASCLLLSSILSSNQWQPVAQLLPTQYLNRHRLQPTRVRGGGRELQRGRPRRIVHFR